MNQVLAHFLVLLIVAFAVADQRAADYVVTVNPNGSFSPATVRIASGDTVEWHFSSPLDSIIPVDIDSSGHVDCSNYKPFNPLDPNEFTGPLPRAVPGVFTLSPEDAPYASQAATWRSTNFTGVFIRPRWDQVHLGEGVFDWSAIDAQIDLAVKNGKLYSIGFKGGAHGTPQWIFDPVKTPAPVTPLDFGFREKGATQFQGSPADANFRKHYFDLLRAFAIHVKARNAHYRALAYIKISGLNLQTHENRLPNDTTQDLATWAGPGRYTPNALFQFYREETALLASEFAEKDMSYALIQDGFPQINNQGEYLGQPTAPAFPLPDGTFQTEALLDLGRTNYGLRFAVQHNGLQTKPTFCPGSGSHPTVLDPNFHYVGSGCPNRWVLGESSAGQITGFQDVAGITNLADLELTFDNAWENSDAIFLEIYEGVALMGETSALPSGLTIGQWAERFRSRQRSAFATLADPFPLVYRHTFTLATNTPTALYYVNGSKCSGSSASFGTISFGPDLAFTSITQSRAGDSVQITVQLTTAGQLTLQSSSDLTNWKPLGSRHAPVGASTVNAPLNQSRTFYRALYEP